MGLTRIQKKERLIRKDLLEQLQFQGKTGGYFIDMVEDYIHMWKLKIDLKKDIDENGLRIKVTSGNGHMTEKPNESVPNLLKYNAQMLKLLSELGLQEPTIIKGDDMDEYC